MAFALAPFAFGSTFFPSHDPFGSFFGEPSFVHSHIYPRRRARPLHNGLVNSLGRCVPFRRYPLEAPSVFELMTIGDSLDRIWESVADRDADHEQETPMKLEDSKKASSPASSAGAISAPNTSTDLATSTKPKVHRLGEISERKTETGTEFDVHLPGLSLDDVKLDLDFKLHALTVSAQKKVEETKEDEFGKRTSIRHVSVSRLLPIDASVKAEDIKADLVDGVLHISVTHKAIEPRPERTSLQISSPSSSKASIEAAAPSEPAPIEVAAPSEPAPIEVAAPSEQATGEGSAPSEPAPSEDSAPSEPATATETSTPETLPEAASTSSVASSSDSDGATVEDAE